jgi:hypothetical protein
MLCNGQIRCVQDWNANSCTYYNANQRLALDATAASAAFASALSDSVTYLSTNGPSDPNTHFVAYLSTNSQSNPNTHFVAYLSTNSQSNPDTHLDSNPDANESQNTSR